MTTLKRMGCCQSGGFWINDSNGDAVALIPAMSTARQERQVADEIVRAVNSHAAMVEAVTYLLQCVDARPMCKCSKCVAKIAAARAALAKAGVE
jgi:hypothetical protein